MPTAPKAKESKTENPRERFKRLAEARTSTALDALDKLAGLANKNSYEYGPEDVDSIKRAISESLERATKALAEGKPPKATEFHL